MIELTFEYWNKLAEQTITISSLLGGFSIRFLFVNISCLTTQLILYKTVRQHYEKNTYYINSNCI